MSSVKAHHGKFISRLGVTSPQRRVIIIRLHTAHTGLPHTQGIYTRDRSGCHFEFRGKTARIADSSRHVFLECAAVAETNRSVA